MGLLAFRKEWELALCFWQPRGSFDIREGDTLSLSQLPPSTHILERIEATLNGGMKRE